MLLLSPAQRHPFREPATLRVEGHTGVAFDAEMSHKAFNGNLRSHITVSLRTRVRRDISQQPINEIRLHLIFP
jgi:hypothetical protein